MFCLTESLPALPDITATIEPVALSRFQMDALIDRPQLAHDPRLTRVVSRITSLRGAHVTWAHDVPLSQLIGSSCHSIPFFRRSMVAPLAILKLQADRWIPKVVIRVVDELDLDTDELVAFHAACRAVGIHFMCLTSRHLGDGYLDGKDFKRAFNGAFFSQDHRTIFCPTLRALGVTTWPAPESRMAYAR